MCVTLMDVALMAGHFHPAFLCHAHIGHLRNRGMAETVKAQIENLPSFALHFLNARFALDASLYQEFCEG